MLQPPSALNPFAAPVSSVSDFVLHVRETLEAHIPLCWVSGEISGLTRAASGHIYFTLKDARAQIRCTMWRNRAQLLAFQLREGMQVEVRALVNVYEARGDLQLSVESIRQAGLGNLFEAFLRLKTKLEGEGLFSPENKRAIPRLPRGVGLITSPAAAALHDMLTALARRAPSLPVVLYPAPVQGASASQQLAAAIATANARAELDGIDLLIVGRGGGSLEDLWAFNEEPLVRAIAASRLPIISGVGHETDTTLADFAADLRAATPTAAAEVASAGWFESRESLPRLFARLQRSMQHRLGNADQTLLRLQQGLIHPRARLARSKERLDALTWRLKNGQELRRQRLRANLDSLSHRLNRVTPQLTPQNLRIGILHRDMQRAIVRRCEQARVKVDMLAKGLALLNPENILQRGYAIVRDEQGNIVRQANGVANHAQVDIQFADAHLKARVERDPG